MTSQKQRLSAEDWILAGFRALAKHGPKALKAEPLARSLGTTKGSFYWHFKNIQDFHTRMLLHWEDKAYTSVTDMLENITDPVERLYRLGELSVTPVMQHGGDRAEPAIRAWGQSDSAVAAAVQRIDRQRLAYVAKILSQLGLTNPDFARIIYAAYIGFGTLSATDQASNRSAMSSLMAAMLALRDS